MLKIQRASAGSGKTFTLAKRYIWNILTFQNSEGKWILRNASQIEDALRHILAITFTNKATNEMKSRILRNLSLIAKAKDTPIDSQFLRQTPYIAELHQATGLPYEKIGVTAEEALRIILNNFSLFKISTIDSFFQEILRTFTFEANINDSYQLEIDNAYVSDAAIDMAIQELDTRPRLMGNASFWFDTLMKKEARKSTKWNLFNKKAAAKSIYANIRNAIQQLETEDFKDIKAIIDLYFENPENRANLIEYYKALQEKGTSERQDLLNKIKDLIHKIEDIISRNNYSEEILNNNFLTHLSDLKKMDIDGNFNKSYARILSSKSIFIAKQKGTDDNLDQLAMEMYTLVDKWKEISPDSYYKNWKIYGQLLPYLGLILEIKTFLSNILESNNLIQLSDTSYILKKIIGRDDAPFVYERLGNRIDHYLIDEFQDTSRMQWDIIFPLLNEGVSKDKESLIIGDPKQSIYRFRNADHSLITDVVPTAFPRHIPAGFSKEENTNWRSLSNIVNFNNYFFKSMVEGVAELSQANGGNPDAFANLFSNVVQFPHDDSGRGYVEVRIFKKNSSDYNDSTKRDSQSSAYSESGEQEEEESADRIYLAKIGPLISQLLERGYRQKEIAVLVNKNTRGQEVIKALIDYNSSLGPNDQKIDFISEESLLISSSPAVQLIIGVLFGMTRPVPINSIKNQEDPTAKSPRIRWNDIKTDYDIYAGKNQHLQPLQRLMGFLTETKFESSVSSLLDELPTPTLSSLVESIVKTFIEPSLRKSDAVYISSFQDLVAEYSASHHNDPASFLEWWYARGAGISVTSPDGTDAVNIMTIHKSKGLEFKCVIIPFATDSFAIDKQHPEWRWVKPRQLPELSAPPILPIITTKELLDSVHQPLYSSFFDQTLTDNLNRYYVAFTRAINELYIFTNYSPSKNLRYMSDFIAMILSGKLKPSHLSLDEESNCIAIDNVVVTENESLYSFGAPLSQDEILSQRRKEEEKADFGSLPVTRTISDYFINTSRPKLKSIASTINSEDSL